ncbi:btb/poz domain-containing protein [Anaeramoeba flamelloides]|uniref:Btb/poz domain-containing protein n=1 Tax=Anaeramoeba flamelloides TaxID=1746091 RepID=A0AAV8A5W0_9EUKA|nr:btb/poz domain-containing protein [Anaeramoeba flamelloides]
MKTTPITEKLQPHINNSKFSDVKFQVGKNKEEMYGHKFVLSINSKYFENLFFSKSKKTSTSCKKTTTKNSQVIISFPNTHPNTFLSVLEFCYLRKTKITERNVFKILWCSKKFGLHELQKLCLVFLSGNLNERNAIKAYQLFEKYQEKKHSKVAFNYIINRKQVFKIPKCFNGIRAKQIKSILKSNELTIHEKNLAQRVIERLLWKHRQELIQNKDEIKNKNFLNGNKIQNTSKGTNEKTRRIIKRRGSKTNDERSQARTIDEEKKRRKTNSRIKNYSFSSSFSSDYDSSSISSFPNSFDSANNESGGNGNEKEKQKAKKEKTRNKDKEKDKDKEKETEKGKEKEIEKEKGKEKEKKKEKQKFKRIESLFDTQMINKISDICDNSTYSYDQYNEELWLDTDLSLMGKVTNGVSQLSLARCLTNQWVKIVDQEDIKMLSYIQWQRFLTRKSIKELLKSELFEEQRLDRFLQYLKSDGNLSIIGCEGSKKPVQNLSQSRKVKIKRSHIKVLLIGAQERRKRRKDVMRSIKSTGISHVSEINLCEKTPSFFELKKYDVVVVYSLGEFRSPTKAGNALADFVDNGGGLIIFSINCLRSDVNDNRELKGRITENDYLPIKKGKEDYTGRRKLGKIYEKKHHIMNEVKSFDGGSNSWHIASKKVTKGSKIITRYDNGNVMIAEKSMKNKGKVVVLNFFPVSDSVRNSDEYWKTNTDGHKIIANSVEYVYQK